MKVLIAITSHVGAILDGSNTAIRETFVQEMAQFNNLDYRFFIGDGTATDEDESELYRSLDAPEFASHKVKALRQLAEPRIPIPALAADELREGGRQALHPIQSQRPAGTRNLRCTVHR